MVTQGVKKPFDWYYMVVIWYRGYGKMLRDAVVVTKCANRSSLTHFQSSTIKITITMTTSLNLLLLNYMVILVGLRFKLTLNH